MSGFTAARPPRALPFTPLAPPPPPAEVEAVATADAPVVEVALPLLERVMGTGGSHEGDKGATAATAEGVLIAGVVVAMLDANTDVGIEV